MLGNGIATAKLPRSERLKGKYIGTFNGAWKINVVGLAGVKIRCLATGSMFPPV
jgi:hypothetical protein